MHIQAHGVYGTPLPPTPPPPSDTIGEDPRRKLQSLSLQLFTLGTVWTVLVLIQRPLLTEPTPGDECFNIPGLAWPALSCKTRDAGSPLPVGAVEVVRFGDPRPGNPGREALVEAVGIDGLRCGGGEGEGGREKEKAGGGRKGKQNEMHAIIGGGGARGKRRRSVGKGPCSMKDLPKTPCFSREHKHVPCCSALVRVRKWTFFCRSLRAGTAGGSLGIRKAGGLWYRLTWRARLTRAIKLFSIETKDTRECDVAVYNSLMARYNRVKNSNLAWCTSCHVWQSLVRYSVVYA